MTWTQRKFRFVTKCLLLLFLGAQACLAVSAGFLFIPSATVEVESEIVATPSCHDENSANIDTSGRYCRLHCSIDSQSIDTQQTPSIPPCLEGAPILALQAISSQWRVPQGAWHDAHSTDPPISIRFCSLLI